MNDNDLDRGRELPEPAKLPVLSTNNQPSAKMPKRRRAAEIKETEADLLDTADQAMYEAVEAISAYLDFVDSLSTTERKQLELCEEDREDLFNACFYCQDSVSHIGML